MGEEFLQAVTAAVVAMSHPHLVFICGSLGSWGELRWLTHTDVYVCQARPRFQTQTCTTRSQTKAWKRQFLSPANWEQVLKCSSSQDLDLPDTRALTVSNFGNGSNKTREKTKFIQFWQNTLISLPKPQ